MGHKGSKKKKDGQQVEEEPRTPDSELEDARPDSEVEDRRPHAETQAHGDELEEIVEEEPEVQEKEKSPKKRDSRFSRKEEAEEKPHKKSKKRWFWQKKNSREETQEIGRRKKVNVTQSIKKTKGEVRRAMAGEHAPKDTENWQARLADSVDKLSAKDIRHIRRAIELVSIGARRTGNKRGAVNKGLGMAKILLDVAETKMEAKEKKRAKEAKEAEKQAKKEAKEAAREAKKARKAADRSSMVEHESE